METFATIENMQYWDKHYHNSMIAYSPGTGEEYSANPADYWNVGTGFTLRDSEGNAMFLVRRVTTYADVAE